MMKKLLENNFIAHYGLPISITVNVVSTTDISFDLKDDAILVYPPSTGIAKYNNPDKKEVNIINYETFFKSLPQAFQNNKNNCDLIVFTSDKQYFLLNELTDKGKKKGKKRKHAVEQMLQVLREIYDVPKIQSFINRHSVKQCCYFNKKSQSPSVKVKAPTSFGRLRDEIPNGFKMPNKDIESFGFELTEFSGNQTYLLEDNSYKSKIRK